MILNPVIQGGSAEKMYTLTDKAGIMLGGEYRAGQILTSREIIDGMLVLTAADGTEIPYATKIANYYSFLFVMPAQDVIATEVGGIDIN